MRNCPLPLLLLLTLGCPKPLPDPGQVVLSCVMDAAKDPKLIDAVMNALAQPNIAAALLALVNPAIGATWEAIVCVLHSYVGKRSADPEHPERYQRARKYLIDHGYEVP